MSRTVAVDDNAVRAVIYRNEKIAIELSASYQRTFTLPRLDTQMGRKTIKRGIGKRAVEGKDLRLADEIDYIQRRAAEHDGRFVTVGPVILFSTDTGDAWLMDPADHLAARLARDGD